MGLREGMVYGVGSMKEKASQGQHGRGQPRRERGLWVVPEKLFFRKFAIS